MKKALIGFLGGLLLIGCTRSAKEKVEPTESKKLQIENSIEKNEQKAKKQNLSDASIQRQDEKTIKTDQSRNMNELKMKTYQDIKHKFEVKYPADLEYKKVMDQTNHLIIFYKEDQDQSKIFDLRVRQNQDSHDTYFDHSPTKKVEINDLGGYYYEIEEFCTHEKCVDNLEAYKFIINGKDFMISFYDSQITQEEKKKIVESFKRI
ncbi:MAG: DUF4367 domain-containing protein [Candidatus Moranbacteria bacterium]|nr:DUF4367 domain-containing protein [Candidatus Moranbacteria bacterium]